MTSISTPFERVAWRGEDLRVADEALERMAECRASFLALLESDPDLVVYGTTSRAGEGARFRLTREEMEEQGRRPHLGSPSSGEPPPRAGRAWNRARAPRKLDRRTWSRSSRARRRRRLTHRRTPLPEVPLRGNGGSGEVLALGHLAAAVAESAGGTELKEPMELINGSPCAAALVANAVVAARTRLALAHEVFALSAEAIAAPVEAYSAPLEELWDDEYETARSRRQSAIGSSRAFSARRIALSRGRSAPRRSLFARSPTIPSTFRLTTSTRVGHAFSTGGYHNGMAYPALDELAASWADLCQVAERQTERFLSVIEQGTYVVLGGFYMVMVGWAEDARTAAQRTLIPLGGIGQNDTAAPTFFAWRKEREAGYCLEAALAVLAALASDELARTGRASPALEHFLAEVKALFPAEGQRRARGEDAERLHRAFTARVFDGRGRGGLILATSAPWSRPRTRPKVVAFVAPGLGRRELTSASS